MTFEERKQLRAKAYRALKALGLEGEAMLEIIYRRPDGALVRSLAHYSYRCGPIGEWRIGDTPLDQIDGEVLSKQPFAADMFMRDWAAEFTASPAT